MKNVVQLTVFVAITFIVSVVIGGEISQNSIGKLMSLSGLNKQVMEIPGLIIAGVEQASKQQEIQLPDTELQTINSSIKSSFDPLRILNKIELGIKKNISESEANELLTWYESNLGKKITRAEEDASTPEAYKQMLNEADSLLHDEQRVNIALKIDNLVKATDLAVWLNQKTLISVFTAISFAIDPVSAPDRIVTFKKNISEQEQEIRKNTQQMIILSFVYNYRNIDIKSIERYISFLSQPISQKLNEVVYQNLKSTLNQAIDNMATSLASSSKKEVEKS